MNRLLILTLLLLSNSSVNGQNNSAGKTLMARGEVIATEVTSSRALKRRSPVYTQDDITTGVKSATQLRMSDGGLLSLQAESLLRISSYKFDGKQKGNVKMSLLKGGLRTVTGAIQSLGSNYALETPVANIGIRGTHYEAELVEADLYLAGWQGLIDVTVTVPNKSFVFSLGPKEDYRFAVVRKNGDVEFFIDTPTAFATGHTIPNVSDATLLQPAIELTGTIYEAEEASMLTSVPDKDAINKPFFDNDQFVSNWLPAGAALQSRTGMANFNAVLQNALMSSQGAVSNLQVAMQIDFDAAIIPSGQLSLNDPDGQWFAVFNGSIGADELDLNVNFASHGNALADGTLEGLLIDNAQSVFANLELFEIDTPQINVSGSFILTDADP